MINVTKSLKIPEMLPLFEEIFGIVKKRCILYIYVNMLFGRGNQNKTISNTLNTVKINNER